MDNVWWSLVGNKFPGKIMVLISTITRIVFKTHSTSMTATLQHRLVGFCTNFRKKIIAELFK